MSTLKSRKSAVTGMPVIRQPGALNAQKTGQHMQLRSAVRYDIRLLRNSPTLPSRSARCPVILAKTKLQAEQSKVTSQRCAAQYPECTFLLHFGAVTMQYTSHFAQAEHTLASLCGLNMAAADCPAHYLFCHFHSLCSQGASDAQL